MLPINLLLRLLLAACLLSVAACGTNSPPPASPMPPARAQELVIYGWADDIPQQVLDTFATEYNVKITYLAYASQEVGPSPKVPKFYDDIWARFLPPNF